MYPPYLSGRSSPTYVKPYVDPYTSHAYFHRLLRQKILLQDERKGYVQGEFTERSMLPVQQSPGIDNICQRTQLAPLTVPEDNGSSLGGPVMKGSPSTSMNDANESIPEHATIISPLVSTATPSFAPGDDPASLSSRTQPVPSPANQTSDPTTPAPNMAASPVAEVPPTVSIPGSPHPVQTKEIADRAAPPTGETPSAAVPLNPQGVPPIPSRAQSSTTDNASAFPSPRAQGQGIKQGGAPSTPQTATPLAAGSPAQSHHLAPSQEKPWTAFPKIVPIQTPPTILASKTVTSVVDPALHQMLTSSSANIHARRKGHLGLVAEVMSEPIVSGEGRRQVQSQQVNRRNSAASMRSLVVTPKPKVRAGNPKETTSHRPTRSLPSTADMKAMHPDADFPPKSIKLPNIDSSSNAGYQEAAEWQRAPVRRVVNA